MKPSTMMILLVEDNRSDAELLTELLSETKSPPDVHWVLDGAEALNYLHRKGLHSDAERPDLVVLDLGLPRVSGYEVLKTVRSRPELASLMVYILTTSQNPVDRSECENLGADAFFSKPKNLKEYDTLVEKIVSANFA